MQNNLLEYHCMVDFARPGQLGSRADFTRQFATQILNGQSHDATDEMKQVMRTKLFAMDQLLSNCVDRADLKTLAEYLPPKSEFAVSVRLSALQAIASNQSVRAELLSTGEALQPVPTNFCNWQRAGYKG